MSAFAPLLQVMLVLLFAPLLQGLIKTAKARLQGRTGPGVLQPSYDLWKYLGRESVLSEHTSWIARVAPFVYFGAVLTACALVPLATRSASSPTFGDAITLVALLALARFVLAIAALDTGSNFAGMGASREIAFGALVEPAFLVVIAALAIRGNTSTVAGLANSLNFGPAWFLALAAMVVIVIAETGRLPIDNPDTHLELTMIHEGMLLEYSGHSLAILLWATYAKQLLVLTLLVNWFFPFGLPGAADAAALAVGLALWVAKVGVLGLGLAIVETSTAKLRIFRAPGLLGTAALLALLAVGARYVLGV